jgi:hypothetical protein
MFNMEDKRDAGFTLIFIEIRSKREITWEHNIIIPIHIVHFVIILMHESSNIIRMITPRRKRWLGQQYIEGIKNAYISVI